MDLQEIPKAWRESVCAVLQTQSESVIQWTKDARQRYEASPGADWTLVNNSMKTKLDNFEVSIPTADGKGVSECVNIQVPMLWDEEIGEWLLAPEANQMIEDTKARHMGLLTPQQIRELRDHLGLTQKQVAALLQLGEKTWTRWESGRERPSRSMNILLHALYDGRIDANYLNLLRQPALRSQSVIPFGIYRTVYAMGVTEWTTTDCPDAAIAA